MYSRSYSYNGIESITGNDSLTKNAADSGRANIPIKSFPDIGAYNHFENDVGKVGITPSDTRRTSIPTSSKVAEGDSSEEHGEPNNTQSESDLSEKSENADDTVAVSAEKTSPSEKDIGLAARLKKGLSRYTGGITSSLGADDILLAAMLILFLTDSNEENDSLIPVILLALIFF